ncbi:C4-type zinc ribbon domain-containing protein [uncultured Parolsenella sp.]|uniref:zinc ribbon domain-containing protein n=1 Tax=uncultured Parolsenella sp. TaxID=2083008 RepID=UPI0027DB8CF7|nr:C4-type zinc ribbon domain-containing protein [uncultured Parolsenella sp.]
MSEASELLRLQEIDLELMRTKNTAEALPQRQKVAAARAAAKKVAGELTKIVGQRKDLEIELADLDDSKRFFSEKVTEIQDGTYNQDFRSAQDMEYNLATLAKKIEKCDYDTEHLLPRLETVERAEKNARALTEKLEREEAAQVASFKQAMDKITEQVKTLAFERERIVADLPASIVTSYEAARKRFGGVAVETLVGNRPSACRVALQPSSFTDIRRSGAEVTTCPYCKRILVVTNEEA